MFSTDKKSLLCIRCFRDMQGCVEGAGGEGLGRARGSRLGSHRESRAHCVDLESAYVQGCERLEQAMLVSAGAAGLGARAPALLRPPVPRQ